MESVWWVFGQLWEKGLVYRGFKVRMYACLSCGALVGPIVQYHSRTSDTKQTNLLQA